MKGESITAPCLLCFRKGFVFVCGCSADVAHSRQFADVQLPVLMRGIVAEECDGDFLFTHLRSPVFLTCAGRCDNIAAVGCAPLRVATLAHFSIYRKKERK